MRGIGFVQFVLVVVGLVGFVEQVRGTGFSAVG